MAYIEFTPNQEKVIQEAVKWYKYSSEQTFEIAGEAGTGKSLVLHEIIRRLKLTDEEYMPMAYTGQAAIVMRTKGFNNAKSIHSSLYKFDTYKDYNNMNTQYNTPLVKSIFVKKDPKEISPRVKLFVIDEGYLVDSYMRTNIESFGRKVLVAGDDRQLPPVSGEPAYLTGYNVHRLTDLMRQAADSPIIYLAHRARNNQPIHCGSYGNNVLVIEDKDLNKEMISLMQSIVCGTNNTRDILNHYIREQIRGIYSDLPEFGERLVCRANNWQIEVDNISLANGLIGTVVNSPSVYGYDPNEGTFTIDFVPDLFPATFYDIHVDYDYYKAPFQEKKNMKFDRFHFGEKFELAYANTAYLSQGAEFSTGMYIEEFLRQNVQAQLNYTGITRFKQNLVYVKKSKQFVSFLT